MTKTKAINVAVAILLAMFIIFSLFSGGGVSVYASASQYSNVLTDLKSDSAFNASEYPEKVYDESINVIQIGESENRELFIYTYQPSGQVLDFIANSISIAKQVNNAKDLSPQLYNLEFINSNGVFYKYKVSGYIVSEEKERFYNLIMIQRPYGATSTNGNIVNNKAYAVGQYWYVSTDTNGEITYRMANVDYVEIINPFTSRIRKTKASTALETSYFQDNYYVAFTTNRNIESLLSATVSYRTRDYFYKDNRVWGFESTEFNERASFTNERYTQKDIKADETVNLEQVGFIQLFGLIGGNKQFTWGRIQSASDFVANAGASSEDNEEIKKLQWVLMFNEVSVFRYESNSTIITAYEESGQIIDLVTVLRLEFIENGTVYNLGTVSDTVSKAPDFNGGAGIEDTTAPPFWVWLVFGGIVLITVIAYFALIIKGLPTTGGLIAFIWGVGSRVCVGLLANSYVEDLTAIIPLLNWLCIAVAIAFVIPLFIRLVTFKRKRSAKRKAKLANNTTTKRKAGTSGTASKPKQAAKKKGGKK